MKTSGRTMATCAEMDEIVQMRHYLLYTSAWVTGNTEKMGEGKDRKAEAASLNTHHANSTVIYGESPQSRGQMTFTHSYRRQISADRDLCIATVFAFRTPVRAVCVCLRAGVYVCADE